MVSPLFPNMMNPGMGGMGNPNRGPNMNNLQRKYGMPSAPRDIGVGGNPYGGGPKTMAPAVMPPVMGDMRSLYGAVDRASTAAPMQSDMMMGLGAAGQMGLLGQLAQQPVPPELVDARNTGALLQQVGMPSQYTQSPYSNVLAQQGSMTQEDRMAALQQLLGNVQTMGQPQMGVDQAYADFQAQQSYAPNMMGGPNPYTLNKPATLATPTQQPIQQPVQQPMPQQPMQGGQMGNRPFAVRGR